MDCVFTCSTCGQEVAWDNAKQNQPTCPRCSPWASNAGAQAAEAMSGGNVADWWRRAEAAWRTADLRTATRCLLEILRQDPDLDQVAWKNLLMSNRVDLSGVPQHLLEEVQGVVKSMGPRAADSPRAREQRLRLISDIKGYVQL
jgi:hypothetical protein